MSLLPGQILPQSAPIGMVREDGSVIATQDWWLLWYNLCLQSLSGGGTGLPSDALQDLEGADTDAIDADAIALRLPVANLAVTAQDDPFPTPSFSDVRNALLLAMDQALPDPPPAAQPVQALTVGASPFSYIAQANGQVSVTAGTVSLIQIIRQGTAVATGLTVGLIMLSRGDTAVITYSATPTMVFLPT